METVQPEQPGDVRALLTKLREERENTKKSDSTDNADETWEKRRSTMGDDGADEARTSRRSPNIDVVVRVRPLNEQEKQRRDNESFHYPGNGAILIEKQTVKPFTFSVVFEPEATQYDLFEHSGVKDLVSRAAEGYTCTCFAFGQTGAGKTYTLLGPDSLYEDPSQLSVTSQRHEQIVSENSTFGIIPRALAHLLGQLGEPMRQGKGTFQIQAHFVEIYNEHIRDLLLLNPRRQPQIRFRRDTGFFLENVFKVTCETLDDLMAVLEEGVRNRRVGSTHSNETSSRGHAILTLEIDSETVLLDRPPREEHGDDVKDSNTDQMFQEEVVIHRRGKMTFVDLAGSEKIPGNVSVQGTAGDKDITHYLETNTINRSLLVLGNCISALSDSKRRNGYIPFRDSNLTKLLYDSLGGNGYTLMIACVTPSSFSVSDSVNTLRYAQRAKNIKNRPKVKMDPNEELYLTLRKEVRNLRQENYFLREQLNVPSRMKNNDFDEKAIQYSPPTSRELAPLSLPKPLPLPRPERPEELPVVRQFNSTVPQNLFRQPQSMPEMDSSTLPRSLPVDSYFEKQSKRDMLDPPRDFHRPLDYANNIQPQRLPPPRAGADMSLYEMLQEYMVENEILRKEKMEMMRTHNHYEREQELLFKENSRLRRKFDQLQNAISRGLNDADSTPIGYRMPSNMNYAGDDYEMRRPRALYGQSNGPPVPYDYGSLRPRVADSRNPTQLDYDIRGVNAIAFQKQPLPPKYVLKPQSRNYAPEERDAPEYYPPQKGQPPYGRPEGPPQGPPPPMMHHEGSYAGRGGPPVNESNGRTQNGGERSQPPPSYFNTPPQTSQASNERHQANPQTQSGPHSDYMPAPRQDQVSVDNMSVVSERRKPPYRVDPIQQPARADETRSNTQSTLQNQAPQPRPVAQSSRIPNAVSNTAVRVDVSRDSMTQRANKKPAVH